MGLTGTRRARHARFNQVSWIVLAALFGVVSRGPAAWAAPTTKDNANVASADKVRDLAKRSADAYRRGDFKEAIALLDEAIAIEPQPVLFYNRARAHEGLGNTDEAIAGYERYLSLDPNLRDRGALEQRLATLKKQRDEKLALEKGRADQEAERARLERERASTPPREGPPKRSIGPYIVGGVGVAGLAAGAVLGVLALGKKDDAIAEPVQRTAIDLKDSAGGFATGSTVSFVVGGVILAAGVTWWVLDRRPRAGWQRGAANLRGLGPQAAPRLQALQIAVSPSFVGLQGALW